MRLHQTEQQSSIIFEFFQGDTLEKSHEMELLTMVSSTAPAEHGINADAWQDSSLKALIEHKYGVTVSLDYVADILNRIKSEPRIELPKTRKALSEDQVRILRANLIHKSPTDFSIDEFAWSNKSVQKMISNFFGVNVSASTARKYIAKAGIELSPAINRQKKNWSEDTAFWFRREYAKLVENAKANGQKVVFLKSKKVAGSSDLVTVSVTLQRTGRTFFKVLSGTTMTEQLQKFIGNFTEGNKTSKPNLMVMYEDCIHEDLKNEAIAFWNVRALSKGKPPKEYEACLKTTTAWLAAKFKKVVFKPIGVQCIDDQKCASEEWQGNNDMSFAVSLAGGMIEQGFNDCVAYDDGHDEFEDALAWITSNCDDTYSFVWCAKAAGVNPDELRFQGFQRMANAFTQSNGRRKATPEAKRIEMLTWAKEYA